MTDLMCGSKEKRVGIVGRTLKAYSKVSNNGQDTISYRWVIVDQVNKGGSLQ